MRKESGQKILCLQTSYLEKCSTDHTDKLPLLFGLARQNSNSLVSNEYEKGTLIASLLKTQGKDAPPKTSVKSRAAVQTLPPHLTDLPFMHQICQLLTCTCRTKYCMGSAEDNVATATETQAHEEDGACEGLLLSPAQSGPSEDHSQNVLKKRTCRLHRQP